MDKGHIIQKGEKQLQLSITKANKSYKHSEENYNAISHAIGLIQTCIKGFSKQIPKLMTFLVGSTGAGKSTTLNYFASADSNFKVKNDDRQITTKNNSVAEIGGQRATTFFPNLYIDPKLGAILDCAGEGDTRGLIIEIINAFIKSEIANKIQQIRIIFVLPYDSLGATAGYGHSFKLALDKNAEFMKDVNHFVNNVGFIITGALTKEKAKELSIKGIKNVLTHGDLKDYSKILEEVIKNGSIETFSKPSENSEIGDTYKPPVWNQDQRKKIIDMVANIPFAKVPSADFFNASTSVFVRESVHKMIKIIEAKAASEIAKMIQGFFPVTIYNVELESFMSFVKGVSDKKLILSDFLKILSWNKFFNVKFDKKLMDKLAYELEFLTNFVNRKNIENPQETPDTQQKINKQAVVKYKDSKRNWIECSGTANLLNEVWLECLQLDKKGGFYFSKNIKGSKIILKPISQENNKKLLAQFDKLEKACIGLYQIQQLGKEQQSKYYKSVTKRCFSHTIQQPYEQYEKYEDYEPYQSWVSPQYQYYYDYETKTRKVTKYKWENYKKRVVTKKKVRKSRQQPYWTKQIDGGGTVGFHFLTLGVGTLTKTLFTGDPCLYKDVKKYRTVYYDDIEQESDYQWDQRQVPYKEEQQYEVQVAKTRKVSDGYYETKYRTKIKSRLVTKYKTKDIFKNQVKRELDQTYYQKDLKNQKSLIKKILEQIKFLIKFYSKTFIRSNQELPKHQLSKLSLNGVQKNYQELIKKWQNSVFEGYFSIRPDSKIEKFDMSKLKF